ncbi:hypothetical protein R1flu_027162 [Riccia fluitans]|uniref:Ubiquitin-like protease family profile domain-containing protein n=1 Tax=Riccia fluitans TaxID=41844 RepID=A0ABD1XHZ7_9MARC
MSRQEAETIARSQKETTTRLGQSSTGPSNHMEGTDVHRGQPTASLQTKSASMAEYRNTVAQMLEECERAIERNTSLKEELVIAQRKIDKLEQRDVQPLVKGLDAEDFDVDAFLDIDMGGPKENITDSTVVPTIGCSIDLTTDEAVDEPCSPPDLQIISVVPSQRVDLIAVVSPKANKCITTEWPCLSDLSKEDRESTYARKYLRGDVIIAYIFEKFLQRSREELFNMFYCSTFWFAKASQQVDAYDMTSHSESASIGIKRLRNTIYPQLRDGDFKVHPKVPTWIFVPIHGKCHWSLALIRLLGTTCAVTHLDSFQGIHKKEYIFHVLRTFLRLTMPICPETIVCGTMEVPHQLDQYSCGIHIIQMMAGAGMKGLRLDQCWREKLAWIATIDQVTTMGIMLSSWLNEKFKHVP